MSKNNVHYGNLKTTVRICGIDGVSDETIEKNNFRWSRFLEDVTCKNCLKEIKRIVESKLKERDDE